MLLGVAFLGPPPLIPALWNIGILLDKQATLGKHFGPECTFFFAIIAVICPIFRWDPWFIILT